jgi:putative hydrolase of the HAD superfamily
MTRPANRSQVVGAAAGAAGVGGAPRLWRGLSLDVGGTLIEPWPSVGHVYATVARQFGAGSIDPQELTAAFGRAWQKRRHFDYSRDAWRMLVQQSFAGVRTPGDAIHITEACFSAIYEQFGRAAAWRVFADVLPTLHALRQREVPIVLVSNWDERLRPLLAELGLLSLVTDVVISHEVGAHKPEPAIFREAARRLDMDAADILHVGDSRHEDYDGARGAGLNARWLRRDLEPLEPRGPEAGEVFAMRRLGELIE